MLEVAVYRLVLEQEKVITIARRDASSSRDTVAIAHKELENCPHERLLGLFLNSANKIIGMSLISTTSNISGTAATTKGIAQMALVYNASAVILAHNHPSGNSSPSTEDIHFTREIEKVLKFLDIPLLDHIIITRDNGYSSWCDKSKGWERGWT